MEYSKKRKLIVASLQEGKIIPRWGIGFLYFGIFLFLFMVVFSVCISIIENRYDVLMCLMMPGIGLPAFIYILIKHYRLLAKVKLWMEDAIECQAEAVTLDSQVPPWIGNRRAFKIQVNFMYGEERITKISGNPTAKKRGLYDKLYNGYDSIFKGYTNRIIKILYSPKYDQVLILKA